MKDFAGKAAFITGGAGGIGLAMARAFGQRGMKIAIADVEAETCARAVETLRQEGIEAIGLACDVSDREALAEATSRAFAEFGKIHVLCNNAGVSRAGPAETIAASDWDWVIGVNLRGLVHGLQLFLPHMKTHGEEGHIVNTASINGVAGAPLAGPYSATKFAVVGLSEVLAGELAETPSAMRVMRRRWRAGLIRRMSRCS
jgi:NAD(P)-dependent dehydrogenase (short-subunit alcohol dehydrogenase family)